jgi:peptidoglycan/LPS O-acetylase OafA/YrhL
MYYPFLDSVRSLAILLVVLHHFRHIPNVPNWFEWAFLHGHVGVDIFFVLSGFLIGGQLVREYQNEGKIQVWRFWVRRWLRTLPVYYIALASVVLFEVNSISSYISALLFLQNYTNPHDWLISWSLCVEEHFYIALPFIFLSLLWVRGKNRSLAVCMLTVFLLISPVLRWLHLEAICREGYKWYIGNVYSVTHLRLEGLFLGVLLAWQKESNTKVWEAIQRSPHAIGLFALVLMGWGIWSPELVGWSSASYNRLWFYPVVVLPVVVSIGTAGLICAGVSARYKDVLRMPGSRWLAEHAYTLYLTHEIARHLIIKWLPGYLDIKIKEYNFWLLLSLSVLVSIIASILLREFVEKPGLSLRRRLIST